MATVGPISVLGAKLISERGLDRVRDGFLFYFLIHTKFQAARMLSEESEYSPVMEFIMSRLTCNHLNQ